MVSCRLIVVQIQKKNSTTINHPKQPLFIRPVQPTTTENAMKEKHLNQERWVNMAENRKMQTLAKIVDKEQPQQHQSVELEFMSLLKIHKRHTTVSYHFASSPTTLSQSLCRDIIPMPSSHSPTIHRRAGMHIYVFLENVCRLSSSWCVSTLLKFIYRCLRNLLECNFSSIVMLKIL